jgi:hypothetical protein
MEITAIKLRRYDPSPRCGSLDDGESNAKQNAEHHRSQRRSREAEDVPTDP